MALDPEAKLVVDLIVAANRPAYETLTPREAREVYLAARRVLQPDLPAVGEIRNLSCPGPAGQIALRLYRGLNAPQNEAQPALVYFHGGGWVIGSIDSHEWVCRSLANHANATVISVDYRLAPEARFPAAVEDSVAATEWVAANADGLGVDADRLAVGGDSAGGNLAAVVAQHAHRTGGPRIGYQLLIYPATDMAMAHPSIAEFAHQLPLTRATMKWFIDHYLRSAADQGDWRASPLKARDLKGLPPAYVMTAGMDPLRDEGEAYGNALKAAGVPVTIERVPGQIHGFCTMGRMISAAHSAVERLGQALARELG